MSKNISRGTRAGEYATIREYETRTLTLTVLGLGCGDRYYDFRGDGIAEDMILLTCCLNASAPELPMV